MTTTEPFKERRRAPRTAMEMVVTDLVQALLRGPKAAASHLTVRLWVGTRPTEITDLIDRAEAAGKKRGIDLAEPIRETREILFRAGHAV
jgi:hypothetical protein